ncbi:MAG: DUF3422 domain-containing protein [Phycisphaerales bacterium]|nr:DUF3422 domain-containing protein [Hyphomonadaceae bacterium]
MTNIEQEGPDVAVAEWRFHPERDRLIAEAHARPWTPLEAPGLVARIVTLSGEGGVEADRAHMATLCQKFGAPEPVADARWCVLDAGGWILRWERHTEVSTWTVFRPETEIDPALFGATALDVVPGAWRAAMPGQVLAAAHVAVVREAPDRLPFVSDDVVAAEIAGGAAAVFTDFRVGPDAFTRFVLVQRRDGAALTGRILQQLLEIETYRLLALLALPLALETARTLTRIEGAIDSAASHVANSAGVEADRTLVNRLAALAGEAEGLAGQTSFRFAAAHAYHGLVLERIASWHEQPLAGRPTIGEFMERRLAPAMRTCVSVGERQRNVIERIARTVQMLSTRVEVASEIVNVELLASMDRRSQQQLRIQLTVEGLSIVAISYYALGILVFMLEAVAELIPGVSPTVLTGLAAPLVVFLVWRFLRRIRRFIDAPPPPTLPPEV